MEERIEKERSERSMIREFSDEYFCTHKIQFNFIQLIRELVTNQPTLTLTLIPKSNEPKCRRE
jgi:hypothetical protein